MKTKLFILLSTLFFTASPVENSVPPVPNVPIVSTADSTKDEWPIFVEALIWVESRGQTDVVGKGDCVGILQLKPIYVAEANRLSGTEQYTLNDRLDSLKSIEMFNIIQKHHNPQKDIDRAIMLHNPGASARYRNDIKNRMLYIKFRDSEDRENINKLNIK